MAPPEAVEHLRRRGIDPAALSVEEDDDSPQD
jgi:hypothetical protein